MAARLDLAVPRRRRLPAAIISALRSGHSASARPPSLSARWRIPVSSPTLSPASAPPKATPRSELLPRSLDKSTEQPKPLQSEADVPQKLMKRGPT
ncbi:hypothetical protein EJB05_56622, partial [Eragrostis curvula]